MTRFCNRFDYLEKNEGFEVTRLPVDSDGRVSPDDLKRAIRRGHGSGFDHGGKQ